MLEPPSPEISSCSRLESAGDRGPTVSQYVEPVPPLRFTVKSIVDPQLKVAQGFSGGVEDSCCVTRILKVPFTQLAGTVKLKL